MNIDMRRFAWAACAAAMTLAGNAAAADAKLVTFFKETCGVCHGEKGEGMPGLAPAFKGNAFITGGSEADIAATITKGREGAAKKYKDLPSPMPPQSMSDSRLKAVIEYLKTDLQK
jgi:mono/diheme cytochrome c family protein